MYPCLIPLDYICRWYLFFPVRQHHVPFRHDRDKQRSEPLSDDFLFPMSTTNESRLSYASSPESDVETGSPGPRMLRASSDPSVATQQDVLDHREMNHDGGDMAPPPPPYTVSTYRHTQPPFPFTPLAFVTSLVIILFHPFFNRSIIIIIIFG